MNYKEKFNASEDHVDLIQVVEFAEEAHLVYFRILGVSIQKGPFESHFLRENVESQEDSTG